MPKIILASAVVCATLLAAAVGAAAQERPLILRATAEHHVDIGVTPDQARDAARIDARFELVKQAATRLHARPDITALHLKPGRLEAYTAVVLVPEEAPAPAGVTTARTQRVELQAPLDADAAARRIGDLHKDQDAAWELVEAWTHTQRLRRQLAEQDRRRRGERGEQAARIGREQAETVTAIKVRLLTAEAYAAFARTTPTTVGGRMSTLDGRARAKGLADQALALLPTSPETHHLIGDLWVEDERPREAEAAYRRGLESGAPTGAALTKLAAAVRLQGQFDEAIVKLREAQALDPAYARAHADHGMILKAQKNLPGAIAAYREAVRIDPDSTDAHNGLAVSLANSGKLEEAVVEFREIIRIDPDSTIGYYNLAYALADLDRDIESAAALREVIRINPDHYNARYNLGELFRLEQKYDDSIVQFREYLRLAPDTAQNRRNISRAKEFIQQFEDPNAPPMRMPGMMPPGGQSRPAAPPAAAPDGAAPRGPASPLP